MLCPLFWYSVQTKLLFVLLILSLTGFSDEAVSAIAVALKTNHSLQTLKLVHEYTS